ncbi:hypothetical protein HNQ94_000242 [Salirhabdus euzebyi]|uniref:Uncharacterized protein n=1 Tax=Salirhabdus euzebyi TaxID=394506 RepID=A0A841PY69_9BACI|nr:hypothetical protein [Salirhabdus euzebyi]
MFKSFHFNVFIKKEGGKFMLQISFNWLGKQKRRIDGG